MQHFLIRAAEAKAEVLEWQLVEFFHLDRREMRNKMKEKWSDSVIVPKKSRVLGLYCALQNFRVRPFPGIPAGTVEFIDNFDSCSHRGRAKRAFFE